MTPCSLTNIWCINAMKFQYYTEATKDDFLRAFSNGSLLTDSELAQLRLHYQQPGHAATPTLLGKLMGERSHHGVSVRNVCMARKISHLLGIGPPKRENGSPRWWAYLVYAERIGHYWQMQLKPEVVGALRQLGWTQEQLLPEKVLMTEFREQVARAYADPPERRRERLEKALKKPTTVQVTRTEFRRNGDVVVEVMLRANGVCEACGCMLLLFVSRMERHTLRSTMFCR